MNLSDFTAMTINGISIVQLSIDGNVVWNQGGEEPTGDNLKVKYSRSEEMFSRDMSIDDFCNTFDYAIINGTETIEASDLFVDAEEHNPNYEGDKALIDVLTLTSGEYFDEDDDVIELNDTYAETYCKLINKITYNNTIIFENYDGEQFTINRQNLYDDDEGDEDVVSFDGASYYVKFWYNENTCNQRLSIRSTSGDDMGLWLYTTDGEVIYDGNFIVQTKYIKNVSKNDEVEFHLINSNSTIPVYMFGSKTLTDVTIGNDISTIGRNAFNQCNKLSSLTISNSVTSIGDYAFDGCSSLTSITIPNSVTSIGNSAFANCSSLASIEIPNSVTSLGTSAFYICSSLKSIKIGNSVTSIGSQTFYNCSGLTSVSLGNSVASIGESAFRYCFNLSSITIPDSVTNIGKSAFYNCSGLTSVSLGNSVASIGVSAFTTCSKIASITIPDSVTTIGSNAFNACSGLTSVKIGDSVTSIGGAAFIFCSSLTSVTIPNSVTSIGDSAFYSCSSLTSVTIPDSVKTINISVFNKCSKLTFAKIGSGITYIDSNAFNDCSGLTSVTINATTPPTLADTTAFSNTNNCPIYVPASSVDTYKTNWSTYANRIQAMSGGQPNNEIWYTSNSLQAIDFETVWEASELYDYIDALESNTYTDGKGVLKFTDDVTDITSMFENTGYNVGSVSLPSSLTTIGLNAFKGCALMQSVEIPNSVTLIAGYAFSGCTALSSITIPNSVTRINAGAFRGCATLTSIEIPSGVTSIGGYGLYINTSSTITRPNFTGITVHCTTPPTIVANTLPPLIQFTNASTRIYVPSGSVNAYKTATNWSTYADYILPIS